MHGCTIGENRGVYPVLGDNVLMFSNSSIIGDCHIGNNVIVSANTIIKNLNVPDNSIVYGTHPDIIIKNDRDIIFQIVREIFPKVKI